MKSDSDANLFKKSGNELYLKSQYSEAISEYNKALCHAESSELMSLLYGNRSAVYFEVKRYSLCLVNIQLAKKFSYPQHKLVKLKAREEKCKDFLSAGPEINKNDEKAAEFFKLSYKSHPKIPFIIDGIELKNSKKYGNLLITNRDLKTGDIIAIEPIQTLFGWLGNECRFEKCSFCLQHNFLSLIPCDKCCDTMYCSESCKEQHKEIFHDGEYCYEVEPPPIESWFETSQTVMKTGDKVLGSFEELYKLFHNPKGVTIFDVDELSTKNLLAIFCSMSQVEIRKKSIAENSEIQCIMQLLGKSNEFRDMYNQIYTIISTNSLELSRFVEEAKPTNKHISTGSAVMLFGSLFNHSCNPNISRVIFDNKMVFYVERPIKAGEQLFMSYGVSFTTTPRKERQKKLIDFGFVCDCDACKKDYPLFDDLRKLHKEMPKISTTSTIDEAIETFKKNCKMITKLQKYHPCYETSALNGRNAFVIDQIAKIRL